MGLYSNYDFKLTEAIEKECSEENVSGSLPNLTFPNSQVYSFQMHFRQILCPNYHLNKDIVVLLIHQTRYFRS
jgi:hypothetical protein